MDRFADLVVEHSSQLGQLDTMVTGKPAMFGRFESGFVGECFRCKKQFSKVGYQPTIWGSNSCSYETTECTLQFLQAFLFCPMHFPWLEPRFSLLSYPEAVFLLICLEMSIIPFRPRLLLLLWFYIPWTECIYSDTIAPKPQTILEQCLAYPLYAGYSMGA